MKQNKQRIGLVLEGGSMRGMYTAGVLDVFLESNIEADIVVGVSAGALFGVNYVSKQNGRTIRYNKKFNQDRHYLGIYPLLKEGNIVNTEYAYDRVPRLLDPFDNETFMNSDTSFYATVTNVETGNAEYKQVKDVFKDMDSLRASGSLPFVSKPVKIDNSSYLDGSISDSVPYEWLYSQGVDKMIVVLTRDMDYQKKPMSEILIKTFMRKYPKIQERLINRHREYNSSINKLKIYEAAGKAFVIRPSQKLLISKLERDPDKLENVYRLGRSDASDILDRLREYLKK